MRSLIRVQPAEELAAKQDADAKAATAKRYYVQAELVEWDYTPLGRDGCADAPFGCAPLGAF